MYHSGILKLMIGSPKGPVVSAASGAKEYDVLATLARGGMAEVYVAKERGAHLFERLVVLKVTLPHLRDEEEFIAAFLDEARLAAQLSHPNIAQIYDLVELEGRPAIVMEWLRGFDLRRILNRLHELGQQMPIDVALAVLVGAASGLGYAHRARDANGRPMHVVHRDISPHNIFVTRDGVAKVIDFGIAQTAVRISKTQEGVVKGKLAYMAPEQLRARATDHRSDLWALGVVAWECLTCQRLFDAKTLEGSESVLSKPILPPSRVRSDATSDLDAIVLGLLERDPERRTADADGLVQALGVAAAHHGVRTPAQIGDWLETLFPPTADPDFATGREFTSTFRATPARGRRKDERRAPLPGETRAPRKAGAAAPRAGIGTMQPLDVTATVSPSDGPARGAAGRSKSPGGMARVAAAPQVAESPNATQTMVPNPSAGPPAGARAAAAPIARAGVGAPGPGAGGSAAALAMATPLPASEVTATIGPPLPVAAAAADQEPAATGVDADPSFGGHDPVPFAEPLPTHGDPWRAAARSAEDALGGAGTSKRRRTAWVVLIVVLAVLAAVVVVSQWAGDSGTNATGDGTLDQTPTAPQTVLLSLEGLPTGATIFLDGMPRQGPTLSLSRDGSRHHLRVLSTGGVAILERDIVARSDMTIALGTLPPGPPAAGNQGPEQPPTGNSTPTGRQDDRRSTGGSGRGEVNHGGGSRGSMAATMGGVPAGQLLGLDDP